MAEVIASSSIPLVFDLEEIRGSGTRHRASEPRSSHQTSRLGGTPPHLEGRGASRVRPVIQSTKAGRDGGGN